MPIGWLLLTLHLPGCSSLKEKRRRLQPLLARLHREFNLSVAEMDRQDAWQEAIVGCAMAGSAGAPITASLEAVTRFIQDHFPDLQLVERHVDFL